MGLTNRVVNYSRQINNTFDQFTSVAAGALCLGRSIVSLITNPGAAIGGIGQIIANSVMGSISVFSNFLRGQLNRILYSTFGIIVGAQQLIIDVARSINFITSVVTSTIQSIFARADYLRGLISGQENCQHILSYMISCFMNKTSGITNDKKALRALSDINNIEQSTLNLLYDTFKQDDFNRFVDKYENEAYKLQTQITKTRQIL
jgi:hypothetical protein